jgi:hypothetical protein
MPDRGGGQSDDATGEQCPDNCVQEFDQDQQSPIVL